MMINDKIKVRIEDNLDNRKYYLSSFFFDFEYDISKYYITFQNFILLDIERDQFTHYGSNQLFYAEIYNLLNEYNIPFNTEYFYGSNLNLVYFDKDYLNFLYYGVTNQDILDYMYKEIYEKSSKFLELLKLYIKESLLINPRFLNIYFEKMYYMEFIPNFILNDTIKYSKEMVNSEC